MPQEKLFQEFPPISTAEWEEIIRSELKGADYEKKLIWKTREGFNVKPYYRSEDLDGLTFYRSLPGEFPFVRGNSPEYKGWKIRQNIWVDNPSEANARATALLSGGVNSLCFCFSKDAITRFLNRESFSLMLRNLPLTTIELHFAVQDRTRDALTLLKEFALDNHIDHREIHGTFDFNVLGNLTLTGKFVESEAGDWSRLIMAVQKAEKHFPGVKTIGIDGSIFRNAGSLIVQELAFSLSMACEYLSVLTSKGVSAGEVLRNLHFTFSTGPVYFLEIAKLRAARMLWALISREWDKPSGSGERMYLHSRSLLWNKTIYDPYVNMLRNTTEAMAAVIGGCDSLTILPFDACYRTPDDFSERMARNVQLILKEEASFGKVADPAAGSWFIENLTSLLAESALELFKATEARGGYLACLKSGFIQDQIAEAAGQYTSALSARKEVLVGTNQYPDAGEQVLNTISEEIAFPRPRSNHSAVRPLPSYRAAEEFEKMRLATEKSGSLPVVFLLSTGDLAMRLARANFSANFFAAAGFRIVNNAAFDNVRDGIDAALKASASIIVLCSSDEEYARLAPEAQEYLASLTPDPANRPLLVVAGAPPCMDDLRAKGITRFIHVRSNLLETLIQFQSELGII